LLNLGAIRLNGCKVCSEIQAQFDVIATALPHIKTGRIRALAVSSVQRSTILPDMPTAAGNRLRCEKCETEIIVVKGTDGEVSCCGQPMAAREG